MGSLQRRTGDKVEPRRANHDAVNRTALHRSAWGNLGGDGQDVSGGLVPNEPSTELEEKGFAEKVEA